MTVAELAAELCRRWDSHLPTVARIVGEYALIYGFVDRPVEGPLPTPPEVELTAQQVQRIRDAYDLAEYRAGRQPIPL